MPKKIYSILKLLPGRKYFKIILRKNFPRIWYKISYYRAAKMLVNKFQERNREFKKMLEESNGKKCLQVGVRGKKFGPHWTSVDLYDKSKEIDFNYDIHDLKFNDEEFNVVVCNAVLEHVQDPIKAISELSRVLKKNGRVWIEVPFNQEYHSAPNDYWRVTPQGLKIWMNKFEEISSGFFLINKSFIHNGTYFYGRKK